MSERTSLQSTTTADIVWREVKPDRWVGALTRKSDDAAFVWGVESMVWFCRKKGGTWWIGLYWTPAPDPLETRQQVAPCFSKMTGFRDIEAAKAEALGMLLRWTRSWHAAGTEVLSWRSTEY